MHEPYRQGMIVISRQDMANIYPVGGQCNSYFYYPPSATCSNIEVTKPPKGIMETHLVDEVDRILKALSSDSHRQAKFD